MILVCCSSFSREIQIGYIQKRKFQKMSRRFRRYPDEQGHRNLSPRFSSILVHFLSEQFKRQNQLLQKKSMNWKEVLFFQGPRPKNIFLVINRESFVLN